LDNLFRKNLGRGIGQRENQWPRRHLRHHLRLEHTTSREPQKEIGATDHFGQCPRVRFLGEARLVRVHHFSAALPDRAGEIGEPNVTARQTQIDEQVDTSQRRGTCAANHQLDLLDALAHDLESVENGGGDDDGGAMLVVVEYRDLHALTQLALDIEALGCLDVFQVDSTEGWLQRRDHLDQLVRIPLIDLDVEHVDAGELLEQYRLAFHHRLCR
jgi:hypothetical protein